MTSSDAFHLRRRTSLAHPLLLQPRHWQPTRAMLLLVVLLGLIIWRTHRERSRPATVSWSGLTMGTTYHVQLAGVRLSREQQNAIREAVRQRLEEIERQMSHYNPESELSRFNRAPAGKSIEISPEFAQVLRCALQLSEDTGGAFDPTLGKLIKAWGFGPDDRPERFPDESELQEIQNQIGFRHIQFVSSNAIVKQVEGLELNLSAIAKGYAVDELAKLLRTHGIENAFVEIGGEVVAYGHNPYGKPWRVGIETPNPASAPGESITRIVLLTNDAIATSGDYRNFRMTPDGRRLPHILDPRTRQPVRHSLASVSVIARDCMTADGLATAAFVLGEQDGFAFIESRPNAEALFIVRSSNGEFEIRMTDGFARFLAPEKP